MSDERKEARKVEKIKELIKWLSEISAPSYSKRFTDNFRDTRIKTNLLMVEILTGCTFIKEEDVWKVEEDSNLPNDDEFADLIARFTYYMDELELPIIGEEYPYENQINDKDTEAKTGKEFLSAIRTIIGKMLTVGDFYRIRAFGLNSEKRRRLWHRLKIAAVAGTAVVVVGGIIYYANRNNSAEGGVDLPLYDPNLAGPTNPNGAMPI